MSNYKVDGRTLAISFMSKGIFSDVMCYKEHGGITVIAVIEGKIKKRNYYNYHFNKFSNITSVDKFIEGFIIDIK